jgi:hypothetical protein
MSDTMSDTFCVYKYLINNIKTEVDYSSVGQMSDTMSDTIFEVLAGGRVWKLCCFTNT